MERKNKIEDLYSIFFYLLELKKGHHWHKLKCKEPNPKIAFFYFLLNG